MVKKLRIAHFIFLTLGILYIIWGYFISPINNFIILAIASMWLLMYNVFLEKIHRRISSELNYILLTCNINEYILICEELLKQYRKKSSLGIAYAYQLIGNNEMALKYLSSVDVDKLPENRKGILFRIHYYSCFFRYHMQTGNVSKASQALQEFYTLLQSKKLSRSQKESWQPFYENALYLLKMKRGNYEGCEEFFERQLQKEKHLLNKVTLKEILGQIYLRQERIIEAIQAFKYVSEYGNDTIYKKRADKHLSALGQELPVPQKTEKRKPIPMFTSKEITVGVITFCMFIIITIVALGIFKGSF
jgi:tetratricopeptide (TPR) repeat protein